MRNWLFTFMLLALAGGIFAAIAKGAAAQTPDATPIPATAPAVTITPTIDRLAAPPTAENPNQADEGAQLFWLHCQPCHGDVGQGLTEDWRQQYPPEDQDCWTSGCHGNRPYENGFTLPTAVPPVIGDDTLPQFETMAQVYGFISAAMPYQDPGYLTQEEYLAMTAFLAREHGVWDGTPLNTENVGGFLLRPAAATETPQPAVTPVASQENQNDNAAQGSPNTFIIGIVVGLIGGLFIIALLIRRKM
jgi:cytochrome c